MTNIDISPEAVERLIKRNRNMLTESTIETLRTLSAALEQSRAETAAAKEVMK